MIKQLSVFVLLLALLCQFFNRAVIVTSYYANTEAYAKNCVNKAKPIMRCNGKCQMMKKLKQEENKDKSNPERRSFQDEVISSKSFYAAISSVQILSLEHTDKYQAAIPALRASAFFHPPGA